jgi:hypothetical protein
MTDMDNPYFCKVIKSICEDFKNVNKRLSPLQMKFLRDCCTKFLKETEYKFEDNTQECSVKKRDQSFFEYEQRLKFLDMVKRIKELKKIQVEKLCVEDGDLPNHSRLREIGFKTSFLQEINNLIRIHCMKYDVASNGSVIKNSIVFRDIYPLNTKDRKRFCWIFEEMVYITNLVLQIQSHFELEMMETKRNNIKDIIEDYFLGKTITIFPKCHTKGNSLREYLKWTEKALYKVGFCVNLKIKSISFHTINTRKNDKDNRKNDDYNNNNNDKNRRIPDEFSDNSDKMDCSHNILCEYQNDVTIPLIEDVNSNDSCIKHVVHEIKDEKTIEMFVYLTLQDGYFLIFKLLGDDPYIKNYKSKSKPINGLNLQYLIKKMLHKNIRFEEFSTTNDEIPIVILFFTDKYVLVSNGKCKLPLENSLYLIQNEENSLYIKIVSNRKHNVQYRSMQAFVDDVCENISVFEKNFCVISNTRESLLKRYSSVAKNIWFENVTNSKLVNGRNNKINKKSTTVIMKHDEATLLQSNVTSETKIFNRKLCKIINPKTSRCIQSNDCRIFNERRYIKNIYNIRKLTEHQIINTLDKQSKLMSLNVTMNDLVQKYWDVTRMIDDDQSIYKDKKFSLKSALAYMLMTDTRWKISSDNIIPEIKYNTVLKSKHIDLDMVSKLLLRQM